MTTIIKAADRNRAIQSVAFNFDDMRGHADEYLDKVREQAKQILFEAAQAAQTIRQQAEQEGRRAGEAAIEATVDRKLAGQMQSVFPALRKAVDDIHKARPAWVAQWERQAIHLATAMAERVIRRELREDPTITVTLVREALELATGSSKVRLLLNPNDLDTLRDQVTCLADELCRLAPAEIVADASIQPGGCRVETQHGTIDQQIESQLARIEEELA